MAQPKDDADDQAPPKPLSQFAKENQPKRSPPPLPSKPPVITPKVVVEEPKLKTSAEIIAELTGKAVEPAAPKNTETKTFDVRTAVPPRPLSEVAPKAIPVAPPLPRRLPSAKPPVPKKPVGVKINSADIFNKLQIDSNAIKTSNQSPPPSPVKTSPPDLDTPPPTMSERAAASKTEPEVHSTTPKLTRR